MSVDELHPSQHHPSWVEIDLNQLHQNIHIVRSQIGPCLYCLPIKANAYGHGLIPIAKQAQASGIDYLAVAHLQEGIFLRQAGIQLPILVLGAIHEDQITDLIEAKLEFTISSRFKAELVSKICERKSQKCRVHLEVDTGMQRTGVRCKSAVDLFAYLVADPHFEVVGIYSHLAISEIQNHEFTQAQIRSFYELVDLPQLRIYALIRHLANSGAVTHYNSSHLDMVRPSLLTFGYPPQDAKGPLAKVKPCFSLKSKVAYFKVVEAGSGISYGHSFKSREQTRIVTVPVGYGDGYRRSLSNRGQVLIRGKRYPIVGTICMDQFMVDIGEDEAYVGDEVVLIGRQGNQEISLLDIAHLCDTIPYEILCQFNERLPRVYLT